MQVTTQTQDPNKELNGGQAPTGEAGFFSAVKPQCTVRNGVILGAALILGTAVYLFITGGDVVDVTPTA